MILDQLYERTCIPQKYWVLREAQEDNECDDETLNHMDVQYGFEESMNENPLGEDFEARR